MTLAVWLASGLGLGYMPWAPGTFGSLPGLPLAWWLLGRGRGTQILIALILLLLGWALCEAASVALGTGDSPHIVADEFLAFPLSVLGLGFARNLKVMGLAFVLYRLFDVFKPGFIGDLESLEGGLGIMLDDVAAAMCVWLVLVISRMLLQNFARMSG